MLKWWKEKGVTFLWWNLLALEIFAGLYAGEKKKLESSYWLTVKTATVTTILPSQSDQQMLVINLSFLSPTSSKTNNRPGYLVSFSWSHTAAQPCFWIINPWIPPWRQRRAQTEVCMHVCVSVGLSRNRGVITCLFLSQPSTPPLRSSYRSRWGMCLHG